MRSIAVDDAAEVAVRASACVSTARADQALAPQAIRDQVRDADDHDAVLARELSRSGMRAIVPSSFMISQITPAGARPASRARSTDASVWPGAQARRPARAQREDVAGPRHVLGLRVVGDRRQDRTWRGRPPRCRS